MPRLTIAAALAAALALALGACGKDEESQSGRDAGGDSATVTTNPTPEARTSTQSESGAADDLVSVSITDIKFVPHDADVKVGQKIVWTHDDGDIPHNVTATKGAKFRSDPTMREGDTFEYTPTKAGTIDYVCTIHSGQDGRLIVTE
jgi:plastocyanin